MFYSLPKSLNLIHTVTIKNGKWLKLVPAKYQSVQLLKVVPVKISSLKVAGVVIGSWSWCAPQWAKGTSANDTQKLTALHPRSESRRGSPADSAPVCHRM